MVIRDTLKSIGFSRIKVCTSADEVWELLEAEDNPPDWIITSVFASERTNVFNLLRLCLKEKRFQQTRISLITSPEESGYLSLAFELGLLSYHECPFTLNTLKAEIQKVLAELLPPGNDCLTSAHFIRRHLSAIGNLDDLVNLEEALIKIFPNKPIFLLNLVEALHMKGEYQKALRLMSQVKILDEATAKAAKQLEEMIKVDAGESSNEGDDYLKSFGESYKISTAVVIDHDESTQKLFQEVFAKIGVAEVQCFNDGEEACAWLTASPKKANIIVQEWRVKKVSGPALIQRYRTLNIKAPVFVYSSLLTPADSSILREMGVTKVISKPMGSTEILPLLTNAIRQEHGRQNQNVLERKIRSAILRKDIGHVKSLIAQLNEIPEVGPGVKLLMNGELAFLEDHFEAAIDNGVRALGQGGDALSILNLMGKAYMKLQRHDEAFKCLQKAQDISPMNVNRLCMLAEISASQGEVGQAAEVLNRAKGIDSQSPLVKSTAAKVAIAIGDTGAARGIMADIDSASEIIAYTNNRAVFLAKKGQVKEAIQTYIQALASLPTRHMDLAATINYNLALVYIRTGDMAKAQSHITKATSQVDSQILAKCKALKSRIDDAVQSGKVLKLAPTEAQPVIAPSDGKGRPNTPKVTRAELVAIDLSPGQLGCHQVFYSRSEIDESLAKLLLKQRSYTHRTK